MPGQTVACTLALQIDLTARQCRDLDVRGPQPPVDRAADKPAGAHDNDPFGCLGLGQAMLKHRSVLLS